MRALLISFLVLSAGCYHIRYVTHEPEAPAPVHDAWYDNFVFGLAQVSDPVEVSDLCPGGFARVESRTTFAEGLVAFATLGVYNPQSVKVFCVLATK